MAPNQYTHDINDTTFLGWTNWDTWNANLWLTSTQAVYRELEQLRVNTTKTAEEFAPILKDHARAMACHAEYFDSGFEFHRVNFEEIAENWNDANA